MISPAEALLHELRNALVPLDFKLGRGTATLEDAAAVVKRLLTAATEVAADLRKDDSRERALPQQDRVSAATAAEFMDLANDIETSSNGDAPAARLRELVQRLQG